eukprot:6132317-Pyramimonas_sp.AAC.1
MLQPNVPDDCGSVSVRTSSATLQLQVQKTDSVCKENLKNTNSSRPSSDRSMQQTHAPNDTESAL